MKSTNEFIKFENGKKFRIYTKMTKKGIRYYYATLSRKIPISRNEINERICFV
jgi:hypothetical protein